MLCRKGFSPRYLLGEIAEMAASQARRKARCRPSGVRRATLYVGASAAIREKLLDIAARGVAILVISEDLDELLEITDRLHVMFRGRLSESISTRGANVEAVGLAMTGAFEALKGQQERLFAHA